MSFIVASKGLNTYKLLEVINEGISFFFVLEKEDILYIISGYKNYCSQTIFLKDNKMLSECIDELAIYLLQLGFNVVIKNE